MSKKRDNFLKGFDNLLAATEMVDPDKDQISVNETVKHHDANTSEDLNVQRYRRSKNPKYKELKKCTLYLPEVLMDSLAIMKVKTKKDLSELAAEALESYLKANNHYYE